MDGWDYWRLRDELSVNEAADLMVCMLPGQPEAADEAGLWLTSEDAFRYRTNVGAAKAAITSAIRVGSLSTTHQSMDESGALDVDKTKVAVGALKVWMRTKGVRNDFFCPDVLGMPGYLDPSHPNYAPKLAAAVRAWQAVTTDASLLDNGKSVKKNLERWLTDHASELGLLKKKDGKPNSEAIEDQIAKVANWDEEGGAPKTPRREKNG
jgi:hypothetical protein